jgi:hypothetical protein
MALQTSTSEVGAREKNSEDCERGVESPQNNYYYYEQIENA